MSRWLIMYIAAGCIMAYLASDTIRQMVGALGNNRIISFLSYLLLIVFFPVFLFVALLQVLKR